VVSVLLGIVAFVCLLFALIDSPPHLMAAAIAAALGWLAGYAFSIHRDCAPLKKECALKASCNNQQGQRGKVNASEGVQKGVDLDMTGYANALGIVAPRGGKSSGGTMEAVLMSALVNEYMRSAAKLKTYQGRYGHMPGAPQCDAGFADMLIQTLGNQLVAPLAPSLQGLGERTSTTPPVPGPAQTALLPQKDEASVHLLLAADVPTMAVNQQSADLQVMGSPAPLFQDAGNRSACANSPEKNGEAPISLTFMPVGGWKQSAAPQADMQVQQSASSAEHTTSNVEVPSTSEPQPSTAQTFGLFGGGSYRKAPTAPLPTAGGENLDDTADEPMWLKQVRRGPTSQSMGPM